MSLSRFPPTNRKAEADDRTPTTSSYASSSNVTTPSHSLSGRDSVGKPDKTKSLLMDTIGIAEKSKVATPDYSKRMSESHSPPILICVNFISILSDLR